MAVGMKDLQKLASIQKKASKAKDELSNIHVEAEVEGLVVTISGELTVINAFLEGDNSILARYKTGKVSEKEVMNAIVGAMNKGLTKAQGIAQEKMKGVMQEMGIDPSNLGV